MHVKLNKSDFFGNVRIKNSENLCIFPPERVTCARNNTCHQSYHSLQPDRTAGRIGYIYHRCAILLVPGIANTTSPLQCTGIPRAQERHQEEVWTGIVASARVCHRI